jgi:hypothetical protein
VTTPAHLLLLPLDNKQVINFFSLSTAGLSSLKESTAFKKITTASKASSFDLNSTGVTFVPRYRALHRLFLSDNAFLKAANFSLMRPHNTLAGKATGRHAQVVLDNKSCDKFLIYNNYKQQSPSTPFSLDKLRVESTLGGLSASEISTSTTSNLVPNTFNKLQSLLNRNPSAASVVNQSNDNAFVQFPVEKFFNKTYSTRGVHNNNHALDGSLDGFQSATGSNFAQEVTTGTSTMPQRKMLAAPDQQILAPEQSVRQFATNAESLTKFNFPTSTTSATSAGISAYDVSGLYNSIRTS